MTIKEIFSQFYNKINETFVEVSDPTNYAQCMDLAYDWCLKLNIPFSAIGHLYAYQVWTQPTDDTVKYFDFIPNTPNGVPQCGDLVIFSNKLGIAGHISIGSGIGDKNSFQSFDQNWGTDKKCHYVTHTYDAVLGWLRPIIAQSIPEPVITDQTKIDIGDDGILEVQAIKSLLKDRKNAINSLTGQLVLCQSNTAVQIKQAIDTTTAERNSFWQPQLDSANQKIQDLTNNMLNNLSAIDLISLGLKKLLTMKIGG